MATATAEDSLDEASPPLAADHDAMLALSGDSEVAVADSHDAWSNDDFSMSISTSMAPSSAIEEHSKSSGASSVHPRLRKLGLGNSTEKWVPKTKSELRSSIEMKAAEIEEEKQSERVQTAVSVIFEMSSQLEDALLRSAANVVNDMQFELAAMRRELPPDATIVGKAADAIEQIPGIVLETVQARVGTVAENLHVHVDVVLRGHEVCDNLVDRLCTMPEEMRRITKEEMDRAVEETEAVVEQHLAQAGASLPNLAVLAETQRQVLPVLKDTLPDALAHATAATIDNATAVVKAVQNRPDLQKAIQNQVVADALLRAKVDSGNRKGNLAFVVANPGSLGHPELCIRPCLYFAAGECVNGSGCNFCHMYHPARPAHLDKRHRNFLKTIDVSDLISLTLPIVEQKAHDIEVPANVLEVIAQLQQFAISCDSRPPDTRSVSRYKRSLGTALRAMTLRSLLTTIQRQLREKDFGPEAAGMFQELLQRLDVGQRPRLGSPLAD